MAESFETLDNILRDWAIDKLQKILAEALNRFEWQEAVSLENDPEKFLVQSQSAVERD